MSLAVDKVVHVVHVPPPSSSSSLAMGRRVERKTWRDEDKRVGIPTSTGRDAYALRNRRIQACQ